MRMKSWLLAACLGLVAGGASAQERTFTPGEVVKVGGGQAWKIIQCRPEQVSRETECEFVEWVNGGAASRKTWHRARWIAEAEARVKEAEELSAMTDAPAADAQAAPGDPAPAPQ